MKSIKIENCDECPYCEVYDQGDGENYRAECERFNFVIYDTEDCDCPEIDIVTEIHPKCELDDHVGPCFAAIG